MSTRNIRFDRRGGPEAGNWRDYARQLELRIERLAYQNSQAIPASLDLDAKQVLLASALPFPVIDFRIARKATLILDQNIAALTIVPPTLSANQAAHCSLVVRQDSTGGRTIGAYSSNVLWPGSTAPTITTDADASDVLAFLVDSDENVIRGMYTQGFPA